MTIPTIVITVSGGVIQDVQVSHQARVVILDFDVEGADSADLMTVVSGYKCWVSDQVQFPSAENDAALAQLLADVAKKEPA